MQKWLQHHNVQNELSGTLCQIEVKVKNLAAQKERLQQSVISH